MAGVSWLPQGKGELIIVARVKVACSAGFSGTAPFRGDFRREKRLVRMDGREEPEILLHGEAAGDFRWPRGSAFRCLRLFPRARLEFVYKEFHGV